MLGGHTEPKAPSLAFHAHAFVHLRPPPSRDKFNQQLLWPPEGPQCAAGQREVTAPYHGPSGCRAELRTRRRPAPEDSRRAWTPVPHPVSSLSPDSPCPPHHSRAAETTTGPVSRGGRGQRSAGQKRAQQAAHVNAIVGCKVSNLAYVLVFKNSLKCILKA